MTIAWNQLDAVDGVRARRNVLNDSTADLDLGRPFRLGGALTHLVEEGLRDLEPFGDLPALDHIPGVTFGIEGKAQQDLLDLDDCRLTRAGPGQQRQELGTAALQDHVVGVQAFRQPGDPHGPVGAPRVLPSMA